MDTIFYSWQSDIAPKTNRTYISDELEKAVKEVNKYGQQYKTDQATRDTPGSPDILENILSKIKDASIFVGDITLAYENNCKKSPNPNVLIELGFALNHLGWGRIILVFNKHFGQLKDLPFDINQKRVSLYEYNPQNKGAKKPIDFFEASLNTITEKNPAKGYFDDVKQKADFELIQKINKIFSDDRLDSFFNGFQDYIWIEDLDMWTKYCESVKKMEFILYDKQLQDKFLQLANLFEEFNTVFCAYCEPNDKDSYKCVFTNSVDIFLTEEHKNDWSKLNDIQNNLKSLVLEIKELIRSKYPTLYKFGI